MSLLGRIAARQRVVVGVVVGVAVLVLGACSSSGKPSGGSGTGAAAGGSAGSSGAGGGAIKTVKLGLLTSMTGAEAATFGADTVAAAKARIGLANASHEVPGVRLDLVTGNDQSTTTGALSGAQQLISQGISEMLSASGVFFAAQPYVTAHGIPTMGLPLDPSWGSSKNQNLFGIWGSPSADYPPFSGLGDYFKQQGGTAVCVLGTAGVPASVHSALQVAASVKLSGLSAPYVNNSVPIGLSDFTAIALQIKQHGCDVLAEQLVTQSTLALLAALKAQGVHLKASLISGGYAQNLLDDPTAQSVIQGLGMASQFQPTSLNTPATTRMMSAMKQYAGYDKPNLTEGQIYGWFAADLAIEGLTVAAPNDTPANITKKLRQVTNYDYDGLTCPVDFTQFGNVQNFTSAGCTWIAVAQGDKFTSATGTTPIILKLLPKTN
jgi:ABC-type branched-subunit amino acid transport system substrate-binding protein